MYMEERPEPAPGAMLASAEPVQEPADVFVPPPGTLPSFVDLTARQALALSSKLGLQPTLIGHGVVIEQNPPPGTPLEAAGELELRFGSAPHQARLVAVAKGAP